MEARVHAFSTPSSQKRIQLAGEISALLNGADPILAVEQLPQKIVSAFADICFIHVLNTSGEISRVEAACADPQKAQAIRELAARYLWSFDSIKRGVGRTLSDGSSIVLEKVDDEWRKLIASDDYHLHLLRELNAHSVCCFPLKSRGKIFGAITVNLSSPERSFNESDHDFFKDIAARIALLLDRAELLVKEQEAVRSRDAVLSRLSNHLQQPLMTIQRSIEKILGDPSDSQIVRREAKAVQRSEEQISSALEEVLEENVGHSVYRVNRQPTLVYNFLSEVLPKIAGKMGVALQSQLETLKSSQIQVLSDSIAIEHALKTIGRLVLRFSSARDLSLKISEVEEGVEISVVDRNPQPTSQFLIIQKDAGFIRATQIVEAHNGRLSMDQSATGEITIGLFLPRFRSS